MVRKCIRAGLFAALGVLVVTMAHSKSATAKDDKKNEKVPEISEIMLRGHKGTDAFLNKIKTEVKGGKWDDAVTHAKALALFGEAPGKNKPPKGTEQSWKTLAGKYATNTKAVLKAAEKKETADANKALAAISSSCGECHKAHR